MSCRTKKSQKNRGKGYVTFDEWLEKNAWQIEKLNREQVYNDMFWRILSILSVVGIVVCVFISNM